MLSLLCRERKPMSQLIAPLQRYFASGEINSEVADKDAKIAELTHMYSCGRESGLDGLSVEFEDWWFNVRKSNTEPMLRLNLEGKTKKAKDEGMKRILKVLGKPEE
jgi:phosphomannomutase